MVKYCPFHEMVVAGMETAIRQSNVSDAQFWAKTCCASYDGRVAIIPQKEIARLIAVFKKAEEFFDPNGSGSPPEIPAAIFYLERQKKTAAGDKEAAS